MKRVENRSIKKYDSCLPKGPVIGPLVIAGVTFQDDSKLVEYRVKDSKQLSPKKREFLAKKIKQIASNYETLVIPANHIDDMRKIMTLNQIEVFAFTKIITKLKPEICYVDSADVNEQRFGRDISVGISFKITIISKHKADELYPVVSAASILAKSRREEEIKKIALKLENKLNLPLGSGYPADPVTQKFFKAWLDKFGKLPPYSRHSWKTSQRILMQKNVKKLDEL
jgi:ribonuclease HII